MPLALQHTKGDQAADDGMPLGPLGARLTAAQRELIFAHTNDVLDLGSHVIQSAHLRGWYRQAIGGGVLGAVSDNQNFEAPAQPTGLSPMGLTTMVTESVYVESAVLLEATHNIPAIVPNPLQEVPGRVPGVKQHILGVTVQVIAGIAQSLQSQLELRGTTGPPEPHTQRDASDAIRPHQQHEGQPIDRFALAAREDPGQALNGPGKGLRHDRIVDNELPTLPDEERATGYFQACVPRPISLQHSRQAVMQYSFEGFGQGDTAGRRAIIEQRGEVAPKQLWHSDSLLRAVGWALYSRAILAQI